MVIKMTKVSYTESTDQLCILILTDSSFRTTVLIHNNIIFGSSSHYMNLISHFSSSCFLVVRLI